MGCNLAVHARNTRKPRRNRKCLLEIATSGFALLAMTREEGTLRFALAPLRVKQAIRFVIARLRRSRGNLAVPGRIVGKPSAKAQLPAGDSHVASLLGMTIRGPLPF